MEKTTNDMRTYFKHECKGRRFLSRGLALLLACAGAGNLLAQGTDAPRADGTLSAGGWSVGLNAGIPFFWGDFVSTAYDKTYVGPSVGVQGSYRFSGMLAATLSADCSHNKMGARGYSRSYLLSPAGMTYYKEHEGIATEAYEKLQGVTTNVNIGFSLDLNINHLFNRRGADDRLTLWVSPTIYGQFFDTKIRLKADGSRYDDGTTKPRALSLGLGGSFTFRYRCSETVDLQLRNSVVWNSDNRFDAVTTRFDNDARHHAMWVPQVGIIWKFKKTNTD